MENNIRYDIVFLRSLAVLAVACYHFELLLFRDGYAGVDIFFVLSGFLMTQIISRSIKAENFSLLDFYFRRLARVLPALLFVVLVFLLVIYFLLGIKLYDFSRFALSSMLFVSNIHLYQSSGYFTAPSQLNFMLHTWSLSVEWQFYILYPLFWMSIRRWLKTGTSILPIAALAVLWLLSFVYMVYSVQVNESFAFYMLPTRVWECLTGAMAFLLGSFIVIRIPVLIKNISAIVVLLLLLLSLSGYLYIGRWGWPSTATLLPVGLTFVLLLIRPDYRLFHSAIVVYFARISYSWYLWHWPIVVLCTYFSLDQTIEVRFFFFLLSVGVSGLAYNFIEKRHRLRTSSVLIIGLLLMIAITFSVAKMSPNQYMFKEHQPDLAQFQRSYPSLYAPEQYNFNRGHLLAHASFDSFDRKQLFNFSDSGANILLMGDCHAGMFSATLRALAIKNKVHLIQATADETFPVPGVRSAYKGPTDLINYMYNSYLPANLHKIHKVVLAANYASYSKRELTEYFNRIDSFFSVYGVPLVFIGQTESYRIEYPVVETLHRHFGVQRTDYLIPSRYYANQFLKRSKIASRYIDLYDRRTIIHGDVSRVYFYDNDHLSTFGTDQYGDLFQQYIFGKQAHR